VSAKQIKQQRRPVPAQKPRKAQPKSSGRPRRRDRLDMSAFRALLLQEQARLTREQNEIESRTARRGKLDAAVEEQDFDENPGDAASETLERGTELALERNVRDLLEQIQLSLSKIEDGSYGVCDHCGRAIAERRLKALPYATLCIECKDRMERG